MIKRLFADIEVSPNVGLFWKPGHKISIDYNSIVEERAIICICYKWEGEKEVHALSWDTRQNDASLLSKFVKVINQADEIVGHNLKRFDMPWIRTRCMYHEIDFGPEIAITDTLCEMRRIYNFNSNRLDYVAQFLGVGGKTHTSYDMWKEITLRNDRGALAKMVHYCKNDVIILEKVYKKLKPFIKPKLSSTGNRNECPECGGDKMRIVRRQTLSSGSRKVQLQCLGCGKHHTIPESKMRRK